MDQSERFQQGDHNSASVSRSTDETGADGDNEGSNVLYEHEAVLKSNGGFEDYPCNLEDGDGILFQVDASEPIDLFFLDSENYEKWRNDDDLDFYYEWRTQISFLKRTFRSDKSGEYVLVVFNPASTKRCVEVTIIALEAD